MIKHYDSNNRILILGNSHLVVFGFRGELIRKLCESGYEVWTCFPNGPFGEGETTAAEYGCHFIETPMERRGTNPIRDIKVIRNYCSIISKIKPSIVLAYTVKPDVYGGIACRIINTPFIPNITGLGKGLDEKGLVRLLTTLLYKMAVKKSACVFFQNDNDKQYFDSHSIEYGNGVVLPGSGVNIQKYTSLPYPMNDEPIRFIYIARIMKTKGIEEYLDAASSIKKKYPNVEFHICGYCEEDYKNLIEEKVNRGDIIYHGLVNNIIDYIRNSHCIVLPSFHPEGISNVLLEGAACARPLITTDRTGCKETVEDGVTGYIVKQKDSLDLEEKMLKFINLNNDERRRMGELGRIMIEKNYDRNIVVNAYINEIEKIV